MPLNQPKQLPVFQFQPIPWDPLSPIDILILPFEKINTVFNFNVPVPVLELAFTVPLARNKLVDHLYV